MSILQAMYAGSSALTNYGNAMSVIGNNLANANTTAFKGSSTTFQDVLIQTVGNSNTQGSTQIGTGVALSSVNQNMKQGSFASTSNVSDLAIDGKGFFMVRDEPSVKGGGGGTAEMYYTRAGDFQEDLKGNLVTNSGLILQGWQLDDNGLAVGQTTDINLNTLQIISPRQTDSINLELVLDSRAQVITNPATYSPNDPTSYNFATSVQVYDAQGVRHELQIHFIKKADNTWDWHVAAPGNELSPLGTPAGTPGDSTLIEIPQPASMISGATPGQLKFTQDGKLTIEGSAPISISFNGASTQELLFDFGRAIDDPNNPLGANFYGDSTNDYVKAQPSDKIFTTTDPSGAALADTNTSSGTVQYASESTTVVLNADGYGTGYLDDLTINADGSIVGVYTNGQSKNLYQIALVDFDNENALDQVGSNLYSETSLSGAPRVSAPQTGRLGSIISYALEQSNVDLSQEFVNMISTQRGFQANSRIVTVTDGMLEELLALKR
ncbi:MAG: flagellar hook protein FlgE [Magnetococcus sp. DMHC-6]